MGTGWGWEEGDRARFVDFAAARAFASADEREVGEGEAACGCRGVGVSLDVGRRTWKGDVWH